MGMSDAASKVVADHRAARGKEASPVLAVQKLPGSAPGDAHYVWVGGIAHDATDADVVRALEKLRVEEARADSALAPRPCIVRCPPPESRNFQPVAKIWSSEQCETTKAL